MQRNKYIILKSKKNDFSLNSLINIVCLKLNFFSEDKCSKLKCSIDDLIGVYVLVNHVFLTEISITNK